MLETVLAWILLVLTAAFVGHAVGYLFVGLAEATTADREERLTNTRRGAATVSFVLAALVGAYALFHFIYRIRGIWSPMEVARAVWALPRPGSRLDFTLDLAQGMLEGRVCAMPGEIEGHRCPYVGPGRALEGGGWDLDLVPWTDGRPFLVAGLRTDGDAQAAIAASPGGVRVVCRLRALAWVRPTELNVWWGGTNPWQAADRPVGVAVVESCRS